MRMGGQEQIRELLFILGMLFHARLLSFVVIFYLTNDSDPYSNVIYLCSQTMFS